MSNKTTLKTLAVTAAVLVAASLAFASVSNDTAQATHQPADKVAVSGGSLEIMTSELTVGGSNSTTVELLTGTLRASSPTDLIFQVTAECALWTHTSVTGNDEAEAKASVKLWVELDGETVAVSHDDDNETGKVVFCDRAYRMETLQFDDEDATIKTFLRTRSANAFNWISLNVGSGTHEIVVKAQLDTELEGSGMAKAAVGKRTLVVEPVKLANDAYI